MGFGPAQGGSGGGASATLAQVLSNGSLSGANDITMSAGRVIKLTGTSTVGLSTAEPDGSWLAVGNGTAGNSQFGVICSGLIIQATAGIGMVGFEAPSNTLQWGPGGGSINQIVGPSDADLSIVAGAGGNNLALTSGGGTAGGDVNVTCGAGTNHAGARVNLKAGDGVGSNMAGGTINATVGARTGVGAAGAFNVLVSGGGTLFAVFGNGNGRVTAQTAANANVLTFATTADSSYIISANILMTAFTGGTISMTCAYTSEDNVARTLTMSFEALAGTFTTTPGATGAFEGVVARIRCKASTNIVFAVTAAAFTGTYNAEAGVMQVS